MESNRKVVEMDKVSYNCLKSVVVWYDQVPANMTDPCFHERVRELMYELIPEIPGFDHEVHSMDHLEVTEDGALVFDVLSEWTGETMFGVELVPKSEE